MKIGWVRLVDGQLVMEDDVVLKIGGRSPYVRDAAPHLVGKPYDGKTELTILTQRLVWEDLEVGHEDG